MTTVEDEIEKFMIVRTATSSDIPSWLELAAEVAPLFGSQRDNPKFLDALERHVERGSAFCICVGDGPPGTTIMGGLLFSPHQMLSADDRIAWLAVAARWRRCGVASRLVEHVIGLLPSPSTLAVVTFGDDLSEGMPARRFYEQLGFQAAEVAPPGPDGGSRQVFRRIRS